MENKYYYISHVDRLEKEVLCISDRDTLHLMPLTLFKDSIEESMVVKRQDRQYAVDPEETSKRRNFPYRLKMLRLEKKLTRRDIALLFGCGISEINQLENGSTAPNGQQLIALSEFFDVDYEFLMGRTNHRGTYTYFASRFQALSEDDKQEFYHSLERLLGQNDVPSSHWQMDFYFIAYMKDRKAVCITNDNKKQIQRIPLQNFPIPVRPTMVFRESIDGGGYVYDETLTKEHRNTCWRLLSLRLEKGIKRVDISRELGIAQSTLSKYESEDTVNVGALSKLADYYETSVDYLLGRSEVRRYDRMFDVTVAGMSAREKKEFIRLLPLIHENFRDRSEDNGKKERESTK